MAEIEKVILRSAKCKRVKLVYIKSPSSYFNFQFAFLLFQSSSTRLAPNSWLLLHF